jgi:hypothetical protein
MRTAIIILAGLALLGLFVVVGGRFFAGPQATATAAKLFIPIWLVAALANLWLGVARAGYSVGEELPIFLAIFVIPAAVAALLWWRAG